MATETLEKPAVEEIEGLPFQQGLEEEISAGIDDLIRSEAERRDKAERAEGAGGGRQQRVGCTRVGVGLSDGERFGLRVVGGGVSGVRS